MNIFQNSNFVISAKDCKYGYRIKLWRKREEGEEGRIIAEKDRGNIQENNQASDEQLFY